jgi:hypothetical protein
MPELSLTLTVLAVLLLALWLTSRLIIARKGLRRDWSRLRLALRRRRELATLLLDTVRRHESADPLLIDEIGELTAEAARQDDPDLRLPIENGVSRGLRSLCASNGEPRDLRASRQYAQLRRDLVATEALIQRQGGHYNASVRAYNLLLTRFPNSLMAIVLGYRPRRLFEVEPAILD